MAGSGGSAPDASCQEGAEDDACAVCLKSNCCEEWPSCSANAGCAECADCLDTESDLGTCVVMNFCNFQPDDATARMLICGLDACTMECGFD